MFDILKKRLPWLYDEYQHLQRLKDSRISEKCKHLSLDDQIKLDEKMYESRIGHPIDWENLQTYTEKMQWEKFYNKDPRKPLLADKYLVRDWVTEKIGSSYLIPLLGVWDNFDDIDFNTLPSQFVLKTNHGTGTNIIVKDKNTFNIRRAKRIFDDWMSIDYGYLNGFETHYSQIHRRIIAEKYLETSLGELQDYKFLCFDGRPYYCWVDLGRYSRHTRTVFDMNWELQPWTQALYGISKDPIPKPKNYEKMIELAGILAEEFAQVRVDFYNVDGVIYFGEMTFTNGRGFDSIVPEKFDYELGKLWKIGTVK